MFIPFFVSIAIPPSYISMFLTLKSIAFSFYYIFTIIKPLLQSSKYNVSFNNVKSLTHNVYYPKSILFIVLK